MASKTRWVCEVCGSAVMGSRRPRLDATVRFCLPCSATSPRLVKRVAPKVEEERQAATAKARDRQRAKSAAQARREAIPWTVQERDLRSLIDPYWKALTHIHKGRRLPTIETPRRRLDPWSTGMSYGWRITLTFGREYGDAAATLLHELVHAALPNGVGHGEAWRTTFMSAARDLYPDAVFRFDELPLTPTKQQVHGAVARGIAHANGEISLVAERRITQ